MLKFGSNVSMSPAKSASTDSSPSSWIFPAWASWLAAAGCSTAPTSAALGPVTVSWVSGDAPRRALRTPRLTQTVQV